MAMKTIRVRVHAGHLEPLEKLPLPEGSELTVSVEVPEVETLARRIKPEDFLAQDLGLGSQEITREHAYDDHA